MEFEFFQVCWKRRTWEQRWINSKLHVQTCLKWYPTLILHFSTGRQILYAGNLKFYAYSTGRKACVIAADLIDSDRNLHCCIWLLSSCYIKISVVYQCRILVAVQYVNTQLFAFFWLTTCTCWTSQWPGHCWCRQTQTELADWQQTHESWNTNTNLKLTQTAATLYTGPLLTNSTLWPAADASTMAKQLHPQQLYIDLDLFSFALTKNINLS